MSEWKNGQVLHMDQALVIHAYPPAPIPFGIDSPGGGGGMGGLGTGRVKWGLYGGPEGDLSLSRPQEATLNQIMGEEQYNTLQAIDEEYAPRRSEIPQKAHSALQTIRDANLGSSAGNEQKALIALIEQNAAHFQLTLPAAYAFYGTNPLYQLGEQFFYRLASTQGLSSRETLDSAFKSWESSYRAAQELNLTSEMNVSLSKALDDTAQRENSQPSDPVNTPDWVAHLEQWQAIIRSEHRIHFQALPSFLQAQIVERTRSTPDDPSQAALANDQAALSQLALHYQSQVSAFKSRNPRITPPLAKFELEALRNLVHWQSTKNIGSKWIDYHTSVLNSESSRWLQETAQALGRLQIRADQAHQQLNQARAEQTAREVVQKAAEQAARLKAAQAIAHSSYRFGTTLGAPAIAQLGHPAAVLSEANTAAIRLGVRTAIVGIAAGITGITLSPLVVVGALIGVVALAWPNETGNAERQMSVALPLAELTPIEGVNWQLLADTGGSIKLPYRLMTAQQGNQAKLVVAQTSDSAIRVVGATYDSEQNVYSVATGSPARTLVWTPSQVPGSELSGPTPLPAESPQSKTYVGPTLTPVTPVVETFPATEAAGVDQVVIVFPADSGLQPVYVMFNSPYKGADTKGEYSGRLFNPDKAGGAIQSLDWKQASITKEGIDLVVLHISRFSNSADNVVMIDRLNKILAGNLAASDTDLRYYTHEIRELERYRNLGVKDRTDPSETDDGETWNNAHAATLEDYKLQDNPDLFYTPEASEALFKQIEGLSQ
ncbi:MAG: S-type pyocin domain-containing protein [Pseudomonas sp.]|nr:S-type pyocin domain-containing protein [Pseudomonas sp.]